MYKKILFAFLLMPVMTVAQKFEPGKVSVAELQQTRHPKDTSAVAAVLYNKGRSYFKYNERDGFTMVHHFEIRIKVYKKEGLKYANYEVPYYIGYKNMEQEQLHVDDALTYNLVDGKIEKTKLSADGKFKEKVNDKWKTVTITMPNVREGSIIEFSYDLKTPNLTEFPVFHFQRDIPVDFVEYHTETPVYYVYKPILSGYVDIKSEAKIERANQDYTNDHNGSEHMTYEQVHSVYTGKDIPALKKEDFIDNLSNYRSSLTNELERIRYPDKPDKDLSKTWDGVIKEIYSYEDFGKQLAKNDYFQFELKAVIRDLATQTEKCNAIFKFVQNRVRWNGQKGCYTDKGVEKAWIDRTGNAAEINFILCSMLNLAGVKARPVLTSTITNGIALFPSRTAFNYVIVAAEPEGKRVLLDATDAQTLPGILPLYVLNGTGRMVDQFGASEEIDLTPSMVSLQKINMMVAVAQDGSVSGKIRSAYKDYCAFDFRQKFSGENKDEYLENLENKLGAVISGYTTEGTGDSSGLVSEAFDFTSRSSTEVIGDRIMLDPLLFYTFTQNPMRQEERKLPVYFGFPVARKYTIGITVPEGYEIESIPDGVNLGTGEGVATFRLGTAKTATGITVTASYEVNKMRVDPDFYPVLRTFYRKILESENTKIILKKKN